MTTKEQYQEAFDSIYAWQKEIATHNDKILFDLNISTEDMLSLFEDIEINGKISIVDSPEGDKENCNYKSFTNIFVDQWSIGMEGDSFGGNIYAEFTKNKWLMIPYEC